jgi:hypothetical protein
MSLFIIIIIFLKPKSFQNHFKYPFRQTKISVNHTELKIHMLQHECKTCVQPYDKFLIWENDTFLCLNAQTIT